MQEQFYTFSATYVWLHPKKYMNQMTATFESTSQKNSASDWVTQPTHGYSSSLNSSGSVRFRVEVCRVFV